MPYCAECGRYHIPENPRTNLCEDCADAEIDAIERQERAAEEGFERRLLGLGPESATDDPYDDIPDDGDDEPDDNDDYPRCTHPRGHKWVYTGSAYGGDDESYHGEGRCYCEHCGADGDA